jgi:hypothetical protein
MTERAGHLLDAVLPPVPYRQWVLSLPFALRFVLAFDHALALRVLAVFVRAVKGLQRRRAVRLGIEASQLGGVTVIQRFASGLRLNLHYHCLLTDGVFHEDRHGQLRFCPLPEPTAQQLERLVTTVRRRVLRLLRRRGQREEAAFVRSTKPQHARCGGFDVHAAVAIGAGARKKLERLCRYVLRPALAQDRLSLCDNEQVSVRLKSRWSDGTSHVVLEPVLARLANFVPRPRTNLLIYHGVLAANAKWRKRVVSYQLGGEGKGPPAAAAPSSSRPRPGSEHAMTAGRS